MRSVLIGCIGLLALTVSTEASARDGFSRPNTSFSEYLGDSRACDRMPDKNTKTDETPRNGVAYFGSDGELRLRPRNSEYGGGKMNFADCMLNKGYHRDPNGFGNGEWRKLHRG